VLFKGLALDRFQVGLILRSLAHNSVPFVNVSIWSLHLKSREPIFSMAKNLTGLVENGPPQPWLTMVFGRHHGLVLLLFLLLLKIDVHTPTHSVDTPFVVHIICDGIFG
jgi:hypothetical protein